MKPYFEQNKNQSGVADIDRPFYVGVQPTDREGYRIASHWHYHIEVIYMASGSARVTIGSDSFTVEQGEFMFIYPCEVHSVAIDAGIPSQHYVIGFDAELLSPMPGLAFRYGYSLPYATSIATRQRNLAATEADRGELLRLIEAMYSDYRDRTTGFELAVTSGIYRLMVWLLRQQRNHAAGSDPLATQSEVSLEAFRRMLIYLNENCHEPITATDAAKLSMMSYSRFAALFKELMRTPFTPYLMFLRIRKAEQLLLDPSRSITQIALETGFHSPSYFIKHFKQAKGMPPKQYRNQLLGQDRLQR